MSVLTTIPADGEKGFSGLNYALVSKFTDVSINIDSSNNATFSDGDVSVSAAFVKYQPACGTGGYTCQGTSSKETGSASFEYSVTLPFPRNRASKRDQMLVLAQNETTVVVVDGNGEAWLMGTDRCGLDAAPLGQSGAGGQDRNGQEVVLTGTGHRNESTVTAAELQNILPA